jgi:hypothetical protein
MLAPNAAVFLANVSVMLTLAFPLESLGLEVKVSHMPVILCLFF